ncbi:MAG TPA: radical SAM protein [Thermoanaerobaculia bacterium]|nr:radical SAM protein [Thermoanaerobaculia bacterium]
MNPSPHHPLPLLHVEWEITHRCNACCLHCYSDSGPRASSSNELSTLEAGGILSQLAMARVPLVTLSGGEPLLREDWRELAKAAVNLGIGINLTTNGALVTETAADEIAGLGVASVTVSLDSHLPTVHDRIRQWPGLFDLAIEGIDRLVGRGVRVLIGFTPNRLNRGGARPLLQLAGDLGAAAVSVSEFVVAGRAPLWLALSGPELRAALEEWTVLRATSKEAKVVLQDFRADVPAQFPKTRLIEGCGAGSLFIRILPDGSVTACSFLTSPSYSLREEPLSEILAKLASELPGPPSGFCVDCEQRSACSV